MDDDNFCKGCGEYTTRRDAFGTLLCAECHQREDDAVESYERGQAKRYGYHYGWKEEQ